MTLTHLKYLVAVETEKGITQAAEVCGVKQPTITIQLRRLEKELNAELIVRNQKAPVTLTPLGKLVAKQAKLAIKEMDMIEDIIKKYKAGRKVRIGDPLTDNELLKAYKKQEKEIKRLKAEMKKSAESLLKRID